MRTIHKYPVKMSGHGMFFVWHLYENVQTRLDIPFEFPC